jgi:hypothetical protein
MSTKTKSTAKKLAIATPQVTKEDDLVFNANIIALNENTVRAVSTLAAAMMFSQPQFAAQTNPSNILGLADLFSKYIQGAINVSQPSEEVTQATTSATPVFG